jgi:hypothetical protein
LAHIDAIKRRGTILPNLRTFCQAHKIALLLITHEMVCSFAKRCNNEELAYCLVLQDETLASFDRIFLLDSGRLSAQVNRIFRRWC